MTNIFSIYFVILYHRLYILLHTVLFTVTCTVTVLYFVLFYCQRHTVTLVKRWIWRYLGFSWLTASIQVRLWRLRFFWPFGYYDQNGMVPRWSY